ncbi:MAG: TatD family hydrolase [Treponema sp.]|nr:TatD family hydrolase [Treponema sp.]
MLEKFSFFDAHFHYLQCKEAGTDDVSDETGCSSCHTEKEFLETPENFIKSFGIHPQNPDKTQIPVLERYLESKSIEAIGECGFDFFTKEFSERYSEQKYVFETQLELALSNNIPIVLHGRKANEKFFSYSNELKRLPGVLFHSFMGSTIEAKSFLARGINAYFSFGKQIFNGNKKVIGLVKELPLESLLLETDAPFQTLKGEKATFISEISKIYKGAYDLKKEDNFNKDFSCFCEQINKNACSFYRL